MTSFKLKATEFKKMKNPVDQNQNSKYVCYIKASSISSDISSWMGTNPREQKMTTNVASKIHNSLRDCNNFHDLNRGIVLSVDKVNWDNKTNDLTIELNDPEIHGNIDGGHTLRTILNAVEKNETLTDRYVFCEIFEGLSSPVELAAARNTSVQVDLKSIEELKNSFEPLKKAFEPLDFSNRIQYKMNEHYNDKDLSEIDVREIIAILIMFSQESYPKIVNGKLTETQPVQSYSGKESSLRKFLYPVKNNESLSKQRREQTISNMSPIIKDIFELWETVETTFAGVSNKNGKRYGSRKYSKYDNGNTVGKSLFKEQDLQYYIPKGLLYPIVASFRALIDVDSHGNYSWKKNPISVWEDIGGKLVSTILDEKTENPDVLAKNTNLWSNLFKEVYIYGYLSDSM